MSFVKRCRVSYTDSEGIEHAVELDAGSLYEAVGFAIHRFRQCEQVKYEPKGFHEFIVEPREPKVQHRLTRKVFDDWLRRPGGSPADIALKIRLKALLHDWRSASLPAVTRSLVFCCTGAPHSGIPLSETIRFHPFRPAG